MMPEVDNDRRSIKIKEGMREAIKQGRWCRKAPVGYKNARDDNNKPIIIPSKDARHIKKLFQMVKNGVAPEIARKELNLKGFNISNSHVYNVLSNIIYTGKLFVPANEVEADQIVEGQHEGIISLKLYEEVQQCLFPNRKKGKPALRKTFNEAIPYRGVLTCSNCGHKMTGSLSRSRTGKRHAYYHCNKCRRTRIPSHKVKANLRKVLSQFEFNENVNELYSRILEDVYKEKHSDSKADWKDLFNSKIDLENKIRNTQDLFADGKIDYEEFKQMKGRYKTKLSEVESELSQNKKDNTKFKEKLKKGINLISNFAKRFDSLDSRGQLKVLRSIFPEDVEVLEKSCRTPRINKVLAALLTVSGQQRTTKKGQIVPFLSCSSLVEPEGFEPSSKQAIN